MARSATSPTTPGPPTPPDRRWGRAPTRLGIEVDDATAEIDANDFLGSPVVESSFSHRYGLASHRVSLQLGSAAVLHPGSGVVFSWRPGPLLARPAADQEGLVGAGRPLPTNATVPGAFLPTEGLDEPLVPLRGVRCIYEQELGGDLNGYVADPMSETMRPPHVVGAALDLTLACGGGPLALGSEYDEFADVAHLDAFESADGVVRRLRRSMAGAP